MGAGWTIHCIVLRRHMVGPVWAGSREGDSKKRRMGVGGGQREEVELCDCVRTVTSEFGSHLAHAQPAREHAEGSERRRGRPAAPAQREGKERCALLTAPKRHTPGSSSSSSSDRTGAVENAKRRVKIKQLNCGCHILLWSRETVCLTLRRFPPLVAAVSALKLSATHGGG